MHFRRPKVTREEGPENQAVDPKTGFNLKQCRWSGTVCSGDTKKTRGRSLHGEAPLGVGLDLQEGCPPLKLFRMTGLKCMAVLKALGEMNRLRIMRLLLKEQLGVNALAKRLKVSEYNVSKHLRILKDAGLLEMEKSGKQRLYGVVPSLTDELAKNQNVLELGCCTFRFDKLPR